MRNIVVLGTGYVGLVSGTCFAEKGNNVICCDIDQVKIDNLNKGIIPIYEPGLEELIKKNVIEGRLSFSLNIPQAIQEAEIIYIAVGTPMSSNGEADLSYVKNAAKSIGENLDSYKVVVNKSTVPVGTGRLVKKIISDYMSNKSISFDVVSNPEFLREGSAVSDCFNMERAVIGAENDRAAQIISELHRPFNTRILITDLESSELIKYASNAFLATKISFINEISKLCEIVGADVEQVSQGMGMDQRIGLKFLQAGVGYGGSCFPKDTQAIVQTASSYGVNLGIIQAAIDANEKQPLSVVEKLSDIFGDISNKRVAVLGIAFKPNTDDLRYAPAIKVISDLVEKGVIVKAYDPVVHLKAQEVIGNKVQCVDNMYDALYEADVCIIMTEWDQIVSMDLVRVKKLMTEPIIIDGRNCLNKNDMYINGFSYYSIGRPPIITTQVI
ncbi:UDP-glucose dehydrogenase family protein [Paenibacillus taichungensis]